MGGTHRDVGEWLWKLMKEVGQNVGGGEGRTDTEITDRVVQARRVFNPSSDRVALSMSPVNVLESGVAPR